MNTIMVGFAYFVMIFLSVRVLISLVNLMTRNYFTGGTPASEPLLSVLIPARNEEKKLPLLLADLKNANYQNMEVIVCDDHSTDSTPEILKIFSSELPELRHFISDPLPEGWLGKNFACHQLAGRAHGSFFLFLDADVRISPDMPGRAVQFMQKYVCQLVSVFPTQLMIRPGELLSVPLMNWVLLSLLPLPLVRHTRFVHLSAANGQCMLFDADSYRQNCWHEKVKSESTEDIVISRGVKESGGRIATLTGNTDIFCRMYESLGEAVVGFSRNVHQYFGGSRVIMALFVLIVLLGWLPVWISWGWTGLKVYLFLVFANRVFVGMSSRNGIMPVILHPIQMFTFAWIAASNIFSKMKGETEWKGRKIQF